MEDPGTTAVSPTNNTTAPNSPYIREESPRSSMDEDDDEGDFNDENADSTISLDEVLYSASSYHAIVKPVCLTMILSAVCVNFVWTEQSRSQGAAEMASYTVFKFDDSSGTSEKVGLSLINALIIVTFVGCMTFGIVLLYKYRCMKCLVGYMAFSSAVLLGMLGGTMASTAIDKYRIPIDKLSFVFLVLNFAVVGTTSIFFGKGIPTYITQGYLIATSVILAWQLSNFDVWTTWALLIMLALYDLCAVLSPCGPLKALVTLMQRDDAPEMPGLLYEAQLPPGTRRLSRRNTSTVSNNSTTDNNITSTTNTTTIRAEPPLQQQVPVPATSLDSNPKYSETIGTEDCATETNMDAAAAATTTSTPVDMNPLTAKNPDPQCDPSPVVTVVATSTSLPEVVNATSTLTISHNTTNATTEPTAEIIPQGCSSSTSTTATEEESLPAPITAYVPLAIARVYNLSVICTSTTTTTTLATPPTDPTIINASTAPLLENSASSPTPAELRADVLVQFPRNGGRIEKKPGRDFPRYHVYGRDGQLRRVLMVDRQGRVYQETTERGDDDDDDDDDDGKPASIRLGLGDFIFYSVLVSQAALYGFPTFMACMLVILAGLGGTLVLLSVYHAALPALPISIFLGVVFYLLTRVAIEPWIQALLTVPFYA